MSKFIYRAIRNDENLKEGLKVGVPRDSNTIERVRRFFYHINNGTNKSYTQKYFISMTEKLEVAQKYRDRAILKNTGIVLIKAEDIQAELIYIKDLEKSELAAMLDSSTLVRAKNYSAADSEVLIDDAIAPQYIKELSPLMLDVLEAINITIAKGDSESEKEREVLEFLQSAYFDSEELEHVLQQTQELNIYEQYFFERFYQQGYSREQVLAEMNEMLVENGKTKHKLDLPVVESLRVGVIKKLLNSNTTLDYLNRYNNERYNSEFIGEQLKLVQDEKEKSEKLSHKDKNIKRKKIDIMRINIEKCKERIQDLEKEINELNTTVENLTRENDNKKQGFFDNLQTNIYSSEVVELNNIIITKKNELRREREKVVSFERKKIALDKEDIIIKLPLKNGKLASRFHGVVTKIDGEERVLSEGKLKTTDSPANYTKMEQSNGVIANGETSFYTVPLDSELSYTGGTTSAVNKKGKGTCLVIFASRYTRKEQGGPNNKERIGKKIITYGSDTEFGLDEIVTLRKIRGKDFSYEFTRKCREEIDWYEKIKKEAILSLKTEMEIENKKRIKS